LPGGRVEHDQPGRVHYTSVSRHALTLDSTGRHDLEGHERWAGLSGGPLLVNGLIVGIMREVPDGWKGEAVEAEPLAPLLRNDASLRGHLGVALPLPESTNFLDSFGVSRWTPRKAAGRINAFIMHHLVSEFAIGNVPFGGRDEDLDHLDSWLDGRLERASLPCSPRRQVGVKAHYCYTGCND